VWSPSNSPLVDHGELIGVVHRCGPEISEVSQALTVITEVSAVAGELPPSTVLHTLAAVAEVHDVRHRIEIEQLRHAIETRDIIGQAKGILMERFSMDATAAFDLLVTFSQKSNTRVADVARKLVDMEHPHTSE
jgi:AmiR/NasT family two-component response regulator